MISRGHGVAANHSVGWSVGCPRAGGWADQASSRRREGGREGVPGLELSVSFHASAKEGRLFGLTDYSPASPFCLPAQPDS